MISYTPNSFIDYPLAYCGQDKIRLWRKSREKYGDKKKSLANKKRWERQTGSSNKGSTHQDFTQSVAIDGRNSENDSLVPNSMLFVQSVTVVPGSDAGGTYSIYPAAHDLAEARPNQEDKEVDFTASFVESCKFEHNINHPGRKQGLSRISDGDRKKMIQSKINKSDAPVFRDQSSSVERKCDCIKYHSHTFETLCFKSSNRQASLPKQSLNIKNKLKMPTEVTASNNIHTSICNVFWKASLSFCAYKHGDAPVPFSSLWPATKDVESLLREGLEEYGLGNALWELCVFCMIGAPITLLRCLLSYKYIRPDFQPDNDASLLHLACLLQNQDAVQLLTSSPFAVSNKLKDKTGMTAEDVCFSSKLRRHMQLVAKHLSSVLYEKTRPHTPVKLGHMDRDAIFRHASHPKHFYEILKKLQMFSFDVNNERNEEGNTIMHIAVKSGVCQLPLLLCLVSLHNANIDLYNNSGLTPLMMVVQQGDQTLCDAMVCLFGASPNKRNKQNGKTALHYAAQENHVGIVDCLLRRGADVNVEDDDLCRPDDLCVVMEMANECRELIQIQRGRRLDMLKERTLNGSLHNVLIQPTDLTVVDDDGYTLVMCAASQNRLQCLDVLLNVSTGTINAQHMKTGYTALAMVAKAGYHECSATLLRYGASVKIKDMQGFLPLHLAVLNNQELVVNELTDSANFKDERGIANRPQDAFVGLHEALRLCRKSSIHERLTSCWEKRQEEIVNPLLRLCAMEGDAEKLYNVLEDSDNLNSRDNLNNQPALFVAIEHAHLEVIQLLVERGSDIRRRDTATGNSVLHLIAKTGNLSIARYFLELSQSDNLPGSCDSRPRLDINALNSERITALHIAAEKGFVRFVNLLISNGASTSLLDQEGRLFTCPQFEGVRIQLEGNRRQHTKLIMSLVADKNKKSLLQLMKHWVPRLDHNLRDPTGDTPLMVASRQGLLPVLQFLLQSAVFPDSVETNDSTDTMSDADSGVPDLPPHQTHRDEMYEVLDRSGEFMDNLPLGASCEHLTQSLNSRPNVVYEPSLSHKADGESRQMGAFLSHANRPRGLSIYHDGLVSHVCAVNPQTGNTSLHSCLAGGDNPDVAMALVGVDMAVLNMQNLAGLTAVHLACKLGRKKCLKKLLAVSGVDVNLYSLDGQLPEDLSSNSRINKMVQQARRGNPVRPHPARSRVTAGTSVLSESLPSTHQSESGGSTINFDKIDERYQNLRQSRAPSSKKQK